MVNTAEQSAEAFAVRPARTGTRQASGPCYQEALNYQLWTLVHVPIPPNIPKGAKPCGPHLTGRGSRLAPLSRPPLSRSAATLAAGADGSMPASLMRFSSRSRSI